jgi:putative intracellular protease/amidase
MSVYRRLSTVSILVLLTSSFAVAKKNTSPAKEDRRVKVAFVVSEGFNMIDFGGPWEVFNVARIRADGPLFETFTVSAAISPVVIELTQTKLSPDFTFDNAPKPDIIVVGAQDWRKEIPGLYAWLKKENSEGVTIMSVCVGSGLLADAGLLDGKHHTPRLPQGLPGRVYKDDLARREAFCEIVRYDLDGRGSHLWSGPRPASCCQEIW